MTRAGKTRQLAGWCRARRGTWCLIVVAVALGSLPRPAPVAASSKDPRQACDTPTRKMTLYAVELPRHSDGSIRLGWGATPETASIPGPTIEMTEGDCLAITVVNLVPEQTLAELRDDPLLGSRDPAMPLGVSLHVHGVKYTVASDGTIANDSWVPSGAARTSFWYAAPPLVAGRRVLTPGTAGTWWYHDHVAGTDHGTGGVASGLFGALIVRRPGDPRPDGEPFVVVLGPNATINLRHWPNTPRYQAREGERVEFLVLAVGDDFHTFHLHGHSWVDNRTGLPASPADPGRVIDAKTIGPSETFGFQVIAGEGVGAGAWMLHCHVQRHSDHGMMTFFDVVPADGSIPVPTEPHHHHPG